jgi:hypothetical protein
MAVNHCKSFSEVFLEQMFTLLGGQFGGLPLDYW